MALGALENTGVCPQLPAPSPALPAAPHAALPSSPQTSFAIPAQPPPHLPPISTFLLFPVVSHPLSHTSSLSSTPGLGCGHLPWAVTPRSRLRGQALQRTHLLPGKKQGKGFATGLTALFTLLSVSVVTSVPCPPPDIPRVTLAPSPALELQQRCLGPPAAPQGWLCWDLVSGRSHEGAPGTHQRWGRNARSRACISCRTEERC